MVISELIQNLKAIQAAHGDIHVGFNREDYCAGDFDHYCAMIDPDIFVENLYPQYDRYETHDFKGSAAVKVAVLDNL